MTLLLLFVTVSGKEQKMPDQYRYSSADMLNTIFDSSMASLGWGGKKGAMDIAERMKIQTGPRCCKCFDYVDKTLKIYIRMNHKIHGPQEYCRKCVGEIPDEKFEEIWQKQKNGKHILFDVDQSKREKQKQAMEKEMSIFRRVKESAI